MPKVDASLLMIKFSFQLHHCAAHSILHFISSSHHFVWQLDAIWQSIPNLHDPQAMLQVWHSWISCLNMKFDHYWLGMCVSVIHQKSNITTNKITHVWLVLSSWNRIEWPRLLKEVVLINCDCFSSSFVVCGVCCSNGALVWSENFHNLLTKSLWAQTTQIIDWSNKIWVNEHCDNQKSKRTECCHLGMRWPIGVHFHPSHKKRDHGSSLHGLPILINASTIH